MLKSFKSAFKVLVFAFPLCIIFYSCDKNKDDNQTPLPDSGKIVLTFTHKVDGDSIRFDKMIYVNQAGNHYEVSDVKWFISDISFFSSGKKIYTIQKEKEIYYIDSEIKSTLTWKVPDNIPVGTYDSMTFNFGIIKSKNITFMFVNAPESAMEWPEFIGGGYHLMMIDGFWLDSTNFRCGYSFHLGTGCRKTSTDTTFFDNSFNVKLTTPNLTIQKDKSKEIQVIMNVDEWFKNPYTFDFNYWGPAIMDLPDALDVVRENGKVGVFSLGYIKDI